MIGLVTDSGAQLPPALRDRFGVHVVPITVVVDGHERAEGVDLDPEEFYARLRGGADVSTAAPSPGQVLATWQAATRAGATEILSIHIGSNSSSTVDAVNLAAPESEVPVLVVDTGTASFPVACCVWAAGTVVERGGTIGEAAAAARAVAATVGNVFVVGTLDLARRGGRLAPGVENGDGVPVLALEGGAVEVVARAPDRETTVDVMRDHVRDRSGGRPQRVGVGHAGAADIADALAVSLRALPCVTEIVRYDVGPSIGAHTGPGTAGCVFFAAELTA